MYSLHMLAACPSRPHSWHLTPSLKFLPFRFKTHKLWSCALDWQSAHCWLFWWFCFGCTQTSSTRPTHVLPLPLLLLHPTPGHICQVDNISPVWVTEEALLRPTYHQELTTNSLCLQTESWLDETHLGSFYSLSCSNLMFRNLYTLSAGPHLATAFYASFSSPLLLSAFFSLSPSLVLPSSSLSLLSGRER